MPQQPEVLSAHAAHSVGPSAFQWLAVVALAVTLIGAYGTAVVRRARRLHRPWPQWRTTAFSLGVLLLAAGQSPSVEHYAHASISGHMAQHVLLGMFAPILLVLGAPGILALGSIPPAWRRPLRTVLTSRALHIGAHPVTTASLHVGGMFVLYLTPLYQLSTQVPIIHHLLHAHFVLIGYLFAWSIAGPDPAPHRPGYPLRLGVLIVAAGAHAFLATFLYSRAGTLPPGADATASEMESAAQLMYYGGDIAELGLAVMLFASWHARPRRARGAGTHQGSVSALVRRHRLDHPTLPGTSAP